MAPNDDLEDGATMMEESDTKMSDSVNDRDGDTTMDSTSDSNEKSNDDGDNKKPKKKKTIEEQYQKLEQIEHVLKRPDTYIGTTEHETPTMFVLDKERSKIVQRKVSFVPGLFKIFDEIIVNAADNKQKDPNMSELAVEIDPEKNLLSVKNNGKGVPIHFHQEHQCYVPTLIFSHMNSGSNYDDSEERTTGGRNGLGAKLTNIFSLKFTVECRDSERELKFKQTFRDNLSVSDEPEIEPITKSEKKKGDYVKISFEPDLKRFQMDKLDEDIVALFSKRVFDVAGAMASRPGKKLVVTLNGEKIEVKNFQGYLNLYEGVGSPVAYEKVGDRWEVGVAPSEGTSQQISFVNAICTYKGGKHVDYITEQIAKHLAKLLNKKNKGGQNIKSAQIKNHLCVFVNCLLDKPTFDSQTKENCTSDPKKFGSTCVLSDSFLKKVSKSPIVENVLSFARYKQNEALKRLGGTKKKRVTGIPKLDDANKAGSKDSRECTLIITEGDSAKTLAMSGLSVVGRDYYGVFPLRGKLLNVRGASHAALSKNEEIKNLCDIIGLKYNTVYDEDNIKTLRYGHLMIMADQDHDGSHIKGLVINFIHNFWPSLLELDFLWQFITPIVKARKGSISKSFYTTPEYNTFKNSSESKGYKYRYYKGLGTSTAGEAKEYFADLETHKLHFAPLANDVNDDNANSEGEALPSFYRSGSDLIMMAFRKEKAGVEDRKIWLNNFTDETYLDYSSLKATGVKYSDFINRELILFSRSDNLRSIPHFVDGFKPSQRKVLFACFKKNLKKEIKVAQLAGYVGERSAYHHGEASLHGTITNMAQNFCGSNNVNLLTPSGQFGTRRMGGKDAASPRYIFTKLEPICRAIFHPDDDDLLNYLDDDGMSIEPAYYVPVIPLVLVNGSDGIGTGWSSIVPNHCPRDIIANLRRMIKGEGGSKLHPNYYGFTGEITPKDQDSNMYNVVGKIERVGDVTLQITELPIRKWTQDYKQFLEGMLTGETKGKNGTKKQEVELKDFNENHTDSTVSFTVIADKEKIDEFENFNGGLRGKFKLTSTLSTANMHLFDTQGKITKFDSADSILSSFYNIRLDFYNNRKALLVAKLTKDKSILSNKARYIREVCDDELNVKNRPRKDILADLKDRGYDLFPKDEKKDSIDDVEEDGDAIDDDDDVSSDADLAKGYDYLMGMKIWSLTKEKVEKLKKELAEKCEELEILEATEPSQIWLNDLDAVEKALDERDELMNEAARREEEARDAAQEKRQKKAAGKKKRAPRKTQKTKKKTQVPNEEARDDEALATGLAESLQERLEVTPTSTRSNGKRKESPVKDDSDSSSDDDGKYKKKTKRVAAGNKRKAVVSGDSDDSSSCEDAS